MNQKIISAVLSKGYRVASGKAEDSPFIKNMNYGDKYDLFKLIVGGAYR